MSAPIYGPALYAVRLTKPNGDVVFKRGCGNRTGIRLYELRAARAEATIINKIGYNKADVVPVSLSFGEPV